MKILFVLPQIYPYFTGGAEIFHYHLIIELAKSHQVGYLGYDDISKENVNFYKIGKVKPSRLFTPLQTIFKLILLRHQYDIVHLNYCQGSWVHWFYYPILKRYFKIDYGLTIHDPSLYEWKTPKLFEKVFNQAKFIAAVSERLKKGYELRCNQEIKYLPPLIPLIHHPAARRKLSKEFGFNISDKVFLFAGSLKASKRPLLMIEAIHIINKKWLSNNNLKFIFAGSGEQEEMIRNKISEYRLDRFVKLIGRIPQEKLNAYYKLSAFYVIPSIHEGKSMSLIEAMFNKIPIIASDAPGINDIIFDEKNGLLFELDNPDHLASKIVKIIEDVDLANRISSQAYNDYLDQFQFQNMMNEYLILYKK